MPNFLSPYTETIKLIAAVAIGCVLLYAGQRVLSWRAAAVQNEARGVVMHTTEGVLQDGTVADGEQDAVNTGVGSAKQGFTITIAEDRRNEPETAARDASVVPPSRLRAYRARRLARERSASSQGADAQDAEAPATAER